MNYKQGFISPVIGIVAILLMAVVIGGYVYWQNQAPAEYNKDNPTPPLQRTACTQEAKQCPDGSYVGRTGPNCEFTLCPSLGRKLNPIPSGSQTILSGIRGTTSFSVVGGVKVRTLAEATRTRLASIEFAIAPIKDDNPVYSKALFIKSDKEGKYKVVLPPGTYWIGPKAKALDPVNYRPMAMIFSEKKAVVRDGIFTQIDISEVGIAP